MAGAQVIWAANHWPVAVEWHTANHPGTEHACQDLQQVDFRDAPAHDILLASPACQGHSRAKGKERPHHDALRSTAWAVVTCAEVHRPSMVLVENVPEFAEWTLYQPWCAAMHALGYALAPMVIDAADHGVPQHRRRLFVVATRSRHPIELKLPSRPHVPVFDCIDWDAGRWSPVEKPGRSLKTLERVRNGRRTFGDCFVMPYYGSGSGTTGRSLHRPLGTLTTKARWALVDGDRMRMLRAVEGKLIQGLPGHYLLPDNEPTAWTLIGNSVCPQVAADLIASIKVAA